MKKLYCILGRTGAGKDTAISYLQDAFLLRPVVSYATRPIREDEVDGREHHFISEEQMKEILANDEVVAYTKIEDETTGIKGYEYCATKSELLKSDIYAIDPEGLKWLKSKLFKDEIQIVSIYVRCDYDIRKRRILLSGRGEAALQKFEDRCLNEEAQFTQFENEMPWLYTVWNTGTYEELCANIAYIINSEQQI